MQELVDLQGGYGTYRLHTDADGISTALCYHARRKANACLPEYICTHACSTQALYIPTWMGDVSLCTHHTHKLDESFGLVRTKHRPIHASGESCPRRKMPGQRTTVSLTARRSACVSKGSTWRAKEHMGNNMWRTPQTPKTTITTRSTRITESMSTNSHVE